jgi:hypothetical protein
MEHDEPFDEALVAEAAAYSWKEFFEAIKQTRSDYPYVGPVLLLVRVPGDRTKTVMILGPLYAEMLRQAPSHIVEGFAEDMPTQLAQLLRQAIKEARE